MKKCSYLLLFMVFVVSNVYGYKLGNVNIHNTFGFYSNDIGLPYRVSYFGKCKYDKLTLSAIYRADYVDELNDRDFYLLKMDGGITVYKKISLRYQHERKRFDVKIKIGKKRILKKENRLGFSIGAKRVFNLFKGKLIWIDDVTIFPYEDQSDQQIRWVAKLVYRRISLLNVLFIDYDHDNGESDIETSYFNLSTLEFMINKNKFTDLSLSLQLQKMTDKENVYRVGLGLAF